MDGIKRKETRQGYIHDSWVVKLLHLVPLHFLITSSKQHNTHGGVFCVT